jgi:hypothetical protein
LEICRIRKTTGPSIRKPRSMPTDLGLEALDARGRSLQLLGSVCLQRLVAAKVTNTRVPPHASRGGVFTRTSTSRCSDVSQIRRQTEVQGKDSRGLPTDRRMTVPDLSQGSQVAERYEVTKWAKICGLTITDFLLRRSIISY